ncbi:response regulator [Myxacorys almedinensis]|uniref:Response regulator n=1 Tax=Myxacorys almedinensis A TaxID=2690445 RepID=A0A8J7Z423_9CYAN|nr:response regulator [Myxacorys almedinensis]NDJ17486.1 response regulator [Myxacorys almedinensis A]
MTRILVVDDVADNSFLLQALLEFEGYQVDTADNGQAALAKIESAPPDLVLLDVMMPEMDGYEVACRIRQNHQLDSVPILFVTGYDAVATEVKAPVQVAGIIRKPVEIDNLMVQVQTALDLE